MMCCMGVQALAPVLQGAFDDLRALEAQCGAHADSEHTLRSVLTVHVTDACLCLQWCVRLSSCIFVDPTSCPQEVAKFRGGFSNCTIKPVVPLVISRSCRAG